MYDEFNYGWVAGKAAFCGWNFVVVGKYEVKSLCCSVEIFFYFYYFFQKKCLVLYFFRHIVIRCIDNASIGEETYGKCNNIFI